MVVVVVLLLPLRPAARNGHASGTAGALLLDPSPIGQPPKPSHNEAGASV